MSAHGHGRGDLGQCKPKCLPTYVHVTGRRVLAATISLPQKYNYKVLNSALLLERKCNLCKISIQFHSPAGRWFRQR